MKMIINFPVFDLSLIVAPEGLDQML